MAMELTNGLDFLNGQKKLGILGAGQLGKMTAIAAANWQLPLWALDKQADYPAAPYLHRLVCGNFNNEQDVLAFGREVDLLTIEIEHVNTVALHQLQAEGLRIHPAPQILDTIKDKGLQKLFYQQHQLPTAPFTLFEHAEQLRDALQSGQLSLPFVQKSRTEGYDGRGVAVIKDAASLHKLLPGPCVVEQLVAIDKEIAVIVARNESGEVKAFPVVEMYFHPEANLVDRLLAPARISEQQAQAATALAIRTAAAFDVCGLLAVEMFIDQQGHILVNEVAPRSHNSGHHTIESCAVSQFEQHLRAVLNLPLGDTRLLRPAVMLNLLGDEGFYGLAKYRGIEEALALPGVSVHLYGKTHTQPFRKMGHITVTADTLEEAMGIADRIEVGVYA